MDGNWVGKTTESTWGNISHAHCWSPINHAAYCTGNFTVGFHFPVRLIFPLCFKRVQVLLNVLIIIDDANTASYISGSLTVDLLPVGVHLVLAVPCSPKITR